MQGLKRASMLAWLLLLTLAGCGNATRSEGESCNVNGECPTPAGDLVCFYGACRKSCRDDSACGAGKRCTCGAGWAPFSEGGKHPGGPFGVCVAGCTQDADCQGTRRCRPATAQESGRNSIPPKVPTVEVVCIDSTAACGSDGLCHASCSSPTDFCNQAAGLSNDRCEPASDGGALRCSAAVACGP